jgi:hypothetical protein
MGFFMQADLQVKYYNTVNMGVPPEPVSVRCGFETEIKFIIISCDLFQHRRERIAVVRYA